MLWFTELAWTDGSAIFVLHTTTHTRYCYNRTFHCFLVAGKPSMHHSVSKRAMESAGKRYSVITNAWERTQVQRVQLPGWRLRLWCRKTKSLPGRTAPTRRRAGAWGAWKSPPEVSDESLTLVTLRLNHWQKAGQRNLVTREETHQWALDTDLKFLVTVFL